MRIRYAPLPPVWPSGARTPESERRWGSFKAKWNATLSLLDRELRQLGVESDDQVTIEAGYSPRDIRVDGLPRRDAQITDPAVIVSFQSSHGPLRYGCDTYCEHSSNIRAIALALEALRAVDRHGVLKRGEQYTGNLALPAADQTDTRREAEEFIRTQAEGLAKGPDLTAAYRAAAKRLHPEGTAPDPMLWGRLQSAARTLGLRA